MSSRRLSLAGQVVSPLTDHAETRTAEASVRFWMLVELVPGDPDAHPYTIAVQACGDLHSLRADLTIGRHIRVRGTLKREGLLDADEVVVFPSLLPA